MLWHHLIAFAVLSLLLLHLHPISGDFSTVHTCKTNFTLVGDKCLLADNNHFTWYEADRYCRSLGAGLLSFQNQTQLDVISQWLNVTLPFTSEFWTSGNTLGQKNVYYWQSTGERAKYLTWFLDDPHPDNGDCLTLVASILNDWGWSNYKLAVRECARSCYHVCEHEPQRYDTRICLQTGSYETVQVLV